MSGIHLVKKIEVTKAETYGMNVVGKDDGLMTKKVPEGPLLW